MNFKKQMTEGLFTNNPIFVQFLGMCSALAITTSVTNAIGMGLSVTAVLICSNVIISLLRKFIVPQVRIAAFIVVISGFVTVVELVMKAYLPDLNKSLGLFIPLIVVNCIILARAESFASKNGVGASALDGLWQGLGYTLAVVVTSIVRELLGTGKLFAASDGSGGLTILGSWYQPANIFILPPGAFLTLAFLVAAFHAIIRRVQSRPDRKKLAEAKAEIIDDGVAPEDEKTDNAAKKAEKAEKKEAKKESKKGSKKEAKEDSADSPDATDDGAAKQDPADGGESGDGEGAQDEFEFLPYDDSEESKKQFNDAVRRFSENGPDGEEKDDDTDAGELTDRLNAAVSGAISEKEGRKWIAKKESEEEEEKK